MGLEHTNGDGDSTKVEDSQEGSLDRLDRYEMRLSQTQSHLAVCEVKIDHLSSQMTESNARLAEKMNEGFERIFSMVRPIADQVHKLEGRVNDTGVELKTLKITEKARASRNRKFKNGVIGLILAAGSAMAGGAGKYLWDIVSK